MIYVILKIRLRQFLRIARETGAFRLLVLLVILFFIFLMTYNFAIQSGKTKLILIFYSLYILAIHISRKDKYFLKKIYFRTYLIFIVEYFILSLPLIFIFLLSKNWTGLLFLNLIILLLSLIRINFRTGFIISIITLILNPFNSNLNPGFRFPVPINDPYAFEWISGIRKNFIVLFCVYALFLVFAFKPYIAIVGIIILSLFISGFYLYGEPREFIESFATNSRQFLFRKIVRNFKYLIISFAPLIIISFIFNHETWLFILGGLFFSLLIQLLSIIFKYGLFNENRSLSRNALVLYMNILFLFLPFFWPAPIIMGTNYYFKARKNLDQYFDD